jgi:hypothetical protein
VLTDRRTGFDRRREYPVTGRLRDRPALLAGVLVAVNLLSAADFFLTQAELQAGIAIEGNPLLAALFEGGPLSAWLFKTTVVLAVTLVIWHQRHRRPILLVALAAFGIYLAVIGYHVAGIMRTIGI